MQGYFNGIIFDLTNYVVTLAIDSTTLVGIISTISFSLFLLWQVFLTLSVLPQFE
jgi:hypothetical protein